MRALNRAHRGKDAPTDVLSFPLHEAGAFDRRGPTRPRRRDARELLLGDVVISLDTARRQADERRASLEREVDRLLVHGILHLAGYDHEISPREERRMKRKEREMLARIAASRRRNGSTRTEARRQHKRRSA